MAVARAKRVFIVFHESLKDEVLSRLQDLGVLHLTPALESELSSIVRPVDADVKNHEKRIQEIGSAISYMGRFSPSQGFLESMAGGKFELESTQFDEFITSERLQNTVAEIRQIEQELSELDIKRTRLESEIHHFQPWEKLSVSIDELRETPNTILHAGSIPLSSLDMLRSMCAEASDEWVFEPVGSTGGRMYFILIHSRECPLDGERILRETGFQPAVFPDETGTPREIVARLRDRIRTIEEHIHTLHERARALAEHRVGVMAAYEAATHSKERVEALAHAVATEKCMIIGGWCLDYSSESLQSSMADISKEIAVLTREPLEDETPPVELRNSPLVSPFQVVTNLYGFPRYAEIDPTPLLAPFFFASFGIAVGEGGYGVLLAVLSKLGLKFLRLGAGGRRLLQLLFYCGIATFIAGILMGSFFAIDYSNLPEFLTPIGAFLGRIQLLNPLEDSLLFLAIVLGIGFLQVWVGVLINAILRWNKGERASAIMHDGGWLVLLPLTVFLGRSIVGIPVLYPWLLAAACIFISAGFASQGIGGKIGAGIYALYGLTGFFGDILSYSRLFALGLATGVIATVVNILASMTKGIPVIGWIFMIILLIFGHVFNLAINALGAFIHTARLQFVEFFTKFFEGGGKNFKPFEKQYKYIALIHSGKEGKTDSSQTA